MLRIQAPNLVTPTADAKLALGDHLQDAGLAAYREITVAAKRLEIPYLQFAFRKLTRASRRALSLPTRCSRRRSRRLHDLAHAPRQTRSDGLIA